MSRGWKGSGSPRARASVCGSEAGDGSDNESSAWEVALSRAVGGLAKVDADAYACTPIFEKARST